MPIREYINREPPFNFVPNFLFANNENGCLFICSPQFRGRQVMFQNSDGTTPVTAASQPVGMLQDLSGNGNHAIQATTGNRPIYEPDVYGGHLVNDGSDSLIATLPNLGNNATLFYADSTGIHVETSQTISGSFEVVNNDETYVIGCVDRELTETEQNLLASFLNRYPIPIPEGAPTVRDSVGFTYDDYVTQFTIDLPEEIEVGDQLFVFYTVTEDDITSSTPAGWSVVYDEATVAVTAGCLTKVADGTEGPITITVGYSEGQTYDYVTMSIRDVGAFESNIANGSNASTAAVPVFAPANGTREYLWLAAIHWHSGARSVTAPPGFTMLHSMDAGYNTQYDTHLSVAILASETNQLPPSNWTSSGNTTYPTYFSSLIALNGPNE